MLPVIARGSGVGGKQDEARGISLFLAQLR